MIAIFTTYPNLKEGKEAARKMVEKKIAACVSLIPIERSIYRWKGKIEEGSEYLLIIKTKEKLYKRVETFIRANHPYELCEIMYFKLKGGEHSYLEWIKRSTLFF